MAGKVSHGRARIFNSLVGPIYIASILRGKSVEPLAEERNHLQNVLGMPEVRRFDSVQYRAQVAIRNFDAKLGRLTYL